jgi:hypothetical protein
VRNAGVVGTTPVLNRLVLSNGTTEPSVPAYSGLHGQGYAATADGSWTTASGGPGGTLSRSFYEQFTVVAAAKYTLRLDSILMSTSFYNTSSGTKVAVLYSKTGFRSDSTEIKIASRNGTALTPGTNGTFTNAFDINNLTAGNTDVYALRVNGSAGITLKAGDTLSFRVYHCTGSGSPGRYVKLKNVIAKGDAVKDPVPTIVATGTLNAFSQTVSAPSSVQTYTVSGSNLTGNITVTPPAGYQVSTDGTTWYSNTSPLTLASTNGSVTATTIRVRLNATAAGNYAGDITQAATGAVTQNIAVTGTAVVLTSVIAAGNVLKNFSQTVGKPTDAQTVAVAVTNLIGAVTITPPAGYEISVDTGKTWYGASSVPVLAGNAGNALSRSLMVRLNASASGIYDGSVMIQANSVTVNVSVAGTAYSDYSINPNPADNYVNIFHGKLYTVAIIRIYNLKGHLMGSYYSKPVTNYTTINISALPKGMYFVELERFSEKVLLRFIKL